MDEDKNPEASEKPALKPRRTPATRVGDPAIYAGVNEVAIQAIKSVFIANGGGVLVLLAFFGSVWDAGGGQAMGIIGALAPSIAAFLAGVALAIVSGFLSYMSSQSWANYHFTGQDELPKYGMLTNYLAVFAGIGSLLSFIIGAWIAAVAFQEVF